MLSRGPVALLAWAIVVHPSRVVDADPIISAPFVTVGAGDTFAIPISISDATDLTSWQIDLAFDPTLVQANEVTEGPLLSAFGATLFTPGVIDNVAGLISLVAAFYVDLPPNPSGSGVAAEVEFLALGPGVSPLTFSSVILDLLDHGFDVENGQIIVTGDPPVVPEPSTLALLASGLALFVLRWLARRQTTSDPPYPSPCGCFRPRSLNATLSRGGRWLTYAMVEPADWSACTSRGTVRGGTVAPVGRASDITRVESPPGSQVTGTFTLEDRDEASKEISVRGPRA